VPELDELLDRYIRDGNVAAMDEIVARTRDRLLATARRIGDPQDAEDTVQATYYALLRRGAEPLDAPLIAWLLTVAVRIAYRRKAARRREVALAEQLSVASDDPGPSQSAAHAERNRNLREHVARLPGKYRDVLVLRYLEGLSGKECARLLECSETALRTRLKRARRLLRSRLHPRVSHGLLALPWWLADARAAPLGVAMKTKIAAVALLIAVAPLIYVGRDFGRADRVERSDREASVPAKSAQKKSPDDAADEETLPPPVDLTAVDRDRDVHGTVVDADGKPVAGAVLELVEFPWRRVTVLNMDGRDEEERGPKTRSAADGTYCIPWQRARVGWLRVSADGFAERLVPLVQAGERMRVVMDEGATLVVIASDAGGDPVEGASVRFFRAGGHDRAFGRQHRGTTDADGRCVLRGVYGPSSGYVALEHRVHGAPGWTEAVIPEPGGRVEVECVFPETRVLRGRVTDADTGNPVARARVGMGWVQRLAVTTGEDGRYELPGWSGSGFEELHVSHPAYGRQGAVVGSAETVDFELSAGDRVVGRLVDEAGVAVVGARLAALGSLERRREQVLSRGYAVSRADGSFAIPGLRRDMGHALIVLARGLGRVLYDFDPAGGTVDLGTVVLRPGLSVEGRVVDEAGDALARVPVVLSGANADRRRYEPTRADPNDFYGEHEERVTDDLGRFRFRDLASGTYTVKATREGGVEVKREVHLGDVDARGVVLAFEVIRGVVVRVVGPDGEPVRGAYVAARSGEEPLQGETDERGEAVLRAVGALTDLHVPFVHQPDADVPHLFPSEREDAGVGRHEVEIVLERGAWISGVVRTPDGKPLPRGYVNAEVGGEKVASGKTNDEGEFRFAVARDARVDLVFAGAVQEGGVIAHEWKGVLRGVSAGARDQVLRLRELEKRPLIVRVVDPDGNPVAGLSVHCMPPAPRQPYAATGGDGRAVFEALPRRKCTIRVLGSSRPAGEFVPPESVEVVPDGQEITLKCLPGRSIRGRVNVEARAGVRVQQDVDGKLCHLGYADSEPDGSFRVGVPASAGNGPFVVEARVRSRGKMLSGRVEEVYVGGPEPVIELRPTK